MRGSEGMSGRLASVSHTHALVSLHHRHADAINVPTKLVSAMFYLELTVAQRHEMCMANCCKRHAFAQRCRIGKGTPTRQHHLLCTAEAGYVQCPPVLLHPLDLCATSVHWFPRGGDAANASQGPESSVPDSLPVSGADTDWREFRARLIRSQTASTSGRVAGQEEEEVSTGLVMFSRCNAVYNYMGFDGPDTGVCRLLTHPACTGRTPLPTRRRGVCSSHTR